MTLDRKAVPVASDRDAPYWEGARNGMLVLQKCVECELLSSQPRVICPRCHGELFEWSKVSGRGDIHSFGIVRQTTASGFEDEVPYVVVHVQIAEEPTCYITSNLIVDEDEFDHLTVGLPVEVTFEFRGDAALPQFQLV